MKAPTLFSRVFAYLQYVLPHHLLSRLMGRLTHCRIGWVKKTYMKIIIDYFDVDLNEVQESNLDNYEHFNAFFTRALKADARPFVQGSENIASPVDGHVSQLGMISDDRIFQAKGHSYSLTTLLGADDDWSRQFVGGEFATLYLSPRDYHRMHMPVDGDLKEMRHIPGRLFSVNPPSVNTVPGLFARNERVVCLFETEFGPMAMVLVGAIFVASIDTVWHGTVTPPTRTAIQTWHYGKGGNRISLRKGEEMGRFNMGSTVILLFGPDKMKWTEEVGAESPVKMGELLGRFTD